MLRQCSSLVHFGRTVREIYPLLNRLPLAPSRQPAKAFVCETPKLVMSYCDMHRHSLCSVFSPSAHDSGCRFPRIDALARRVCINGRHRVRTTAPRLWLCTSLQRWLCFKSAVRGLSYPEPPDFSRWRTVQASPRCLPHCCGLISLPLQNRFCCCHTAPVLALLASRAGVAFAS